MPVVTLGTPPALHAGAKYGEYRLWLLGRFFQRFCSYCFTQHGSLEVDHYEPQAYAPARVNDPNNLLLACKSCNGPSGKWDYHPRHATRRACPDDKTGFLVIDVRVDDFASLFVISDDGSIAALPGPNEERAKWNITLLKLRLLKNARKNNLDLLSACERALAACADPLKIASRADFEHVLAKLLPDLVRRALFFTVYGIRISPQLKKRMEDVRRELNE